jgi:hypothetical protein
MLVVQTVVVTTTTNRSVEAVREWKEQEEEQLEKEICHLIVLVVAGKILILVLEGAVAVVKVEVVVEV